MEQQPHQAPQRGKRAKILLNIVIALCIVVLGVAVFQLGRTGLEYKRGSDEYKRLAQSYVPAAASGGPAFAALDYEALRALNPDFIGWLDIPGTEISYPVVYRAGDNDTYIGTTFEGQANGAGAIFADGRAPGDLSAPHTILYGHNMKNNTMFSGLTRFLDSDYRQTHEMVLLYTPAGVYHYRVFAARQTTTADGVYQLAFGSEEEAARWAMAMGSPNPAAKTLTLSTCTNGEEDGRYVILAVLEGVTSAGEGPLT